MIFVYFDVYISTSGFKNVNLDNLFSSGLILLNDFAFCFVLITDPTERCCYEVRHVQTFAH